MSCCASSSPVTVPPWPLISNECGQSWPQCTSLARVYRRLPERGKLGRVFGNRHTHGSSAPHNFSDSRRASRHRRTAAPPYPPAPCSWHDFTIEFRGEFDVVDARKTSWRILTSTSTRGPWDAPDHAPVAGRESRRPIRCRIDGPAPDRRRLADRYARLGLGFIAARSARAAGRPTVSILRRTLPSSWAMKNPPMPVNPMWSYVKRVPPSWGCSR